MEGRPSHQDLATPVSTGRVAARRDEPLFVDFCASCAARLFLR